jgi:proline dehydrogenase
MFNKALANIIPWFPKPFIWQFSKSYVSGETLVSAINVSQELNAKGMMVTIDLLGEFINRMEQAEENVREYLRILDTLKDNGINGNVSVKPTFFGLLIDTEGAYQNIRTVVAKAAENQNFVRIDMEDSDCTDREIELFRRLKKEFPNNVGLVFQAYLKRTTNDVKALQEFHSMSTPLNFRLCKGIYVEPEQIAYKSYQKVRDNYLMLLEQMIVAGNYAAIATHDRYLVEGAYKLISKYNLLPHQYEFQMLYGVTPALRDEIVSKGHRMRIYVPYGKDWFGYCTRRLKENPKMASTLLKAVFVKN